MNTTKKSILWAGILGASGVILGAFGAHWLKSVLEPNALNSFNTGVRYQLYHALFLLAIANLSTHLDEKKQKSLLMLTLTGILFFSGSIYALSLGSILNTSLSFLGPITPLGGLMLISAWILLIVYVSRK